MGSTYRHVNTAWLRLDRHKYKGFKMTLPSKLTKVSGLMNVETYIGDGMKNRELHLITKSDGSYKVKCRSTADEWDVLSFEKGCAKLPLLQNKLGEEYVLFQITKRGSK